MILPMVDPEAAAVTLRVHLDRYWETRELDARGWERQFLDSMHVVVTIPAMRPDGATEPYFIRLGAEHYDVYPPTVLFVQPTAGWPRARAGTPWWPRIAPPTWFGLHDSYRFANHEEGQLVCFSMTAEYYQSDHQPTEAQRWMQGRRTVAATLSRLAEVLHPPYYQGPDRDRDS